MTRLATPPSGTVLDCYAGSGTTGQAADLEGLHSILIENDPHSVELIKTRTGAAVGVSSEDGPSIGT